MKQIRVAEMFAGVGGFRLALEGYADESGVSHLPPAGHFKTVWANQWEPPGTRTKQFAWRCYEEHFGEGSCVNEDIEVVLKSVKDGKKEIPDFDLLVGGFPCFVAGTPVFTKCGYRNIEDIQVGDEVLTHKGRFKSVIKLGCKKNAPLVKVRVMGSLPITCTPNHPFMVRERTIVVRNNRRIVSFGPLIEKPASELTPNVDFVMYPKIKNCNYFTDMTEEEAWLVGRYVADGHLDTRHRSGRKNSYYKKVIFSIGNNKADEFADMLNEYHATRHEHSQSTERFIITSERLILLIAEFTSGERAANKAFSPNALMLPDNLATAMLAGYESGDGSIQRSNNDMSDRSATTVSQDLARTLSLLVYRTKNKVASISKFERPATTVIGGRIVNQNDTYTVRYKGGEYKHRQFYEIENRLYTPVRSVNKLEKTALVYNFEVEDDHTYVVENVVVHNCQDYSIAKPAPMAKGIEGKKGVLWWSIQQLVEMKRPKYLLLENVDRLLKSPTSQRGRDFGIILSCLNQLGYLVEWRIVNAADYGMPQRRRRVFIYAEQKVKCQNIESRAIESGVLTEAFPISSYDAVNEFDIPADPYEVSSSFGSSKKSPFRNGGVMLAGHVWTADMKPRFDGVNKTIRDIMVSDQEVSEEYFVAPEKLDKWVYLKGAKKEERTAKTGFKYKYSEGPVAFPDDLDKPARTILTSEGGSGPSRTKHVIRGDSGRLRRLVGDELDALQGFPAGWTRGMTPNQRAFCMGNALVVGIPHKVGKVIAARAASQD